jgi:hypothetical protein
MPMLSRAQNRAMHAAAEGKSTLGIPKSVGQKFVTASHGEKVRDLPERVPKKACGGAVRKMAKGGRVYPCQSKW